MGCIFSKEILEEEDTLQADIGIPANFVNYDSTRIAIEENDDMKYLVNNSYF
jgi:hypothetical protein